MSKAQEGRWVVVKLLSGEYSLSGYDAEELISTHGTKEEAQHARSIARHMIGETDPERRLWVIGVALAPEPTGNYAVQSDEKDMIWATEVPDLEWE